MASSAITDRTVILVSADMDFRGRLREALIGLRWQVREAGGGAEAMAELEAERPAVLLMDSWLPDLEVTEFAGDVRALYPGMDLLQVDDIGENAGSGLRSAGKNELLHALREARAGASGEAVPRPQGVQQSGSVTERTSGVVAGVMSQAEENATGIAEMIGRSAAMCGLADLMRLVAPRSTTVLIEGETGTGKEVVAQALHRLSARAGKTFTVLNCAAIPEALLEAELFGHTRGAFTGAVQSRTGRIEAAHGGTLFLDEIGEMPIALQAKMLRFLECGELQRVGDNQMLQVDVRILAATHQALEQRAADRTFRLDLYHRLAVFPIEVPPLRERPEDIELLAEHFLEKMGREMPRKRLSSAAQARLKTHDWPGNVRELAHVLERGAILAGDSPVIGADEIRYRRATQA